MDSRRNGRSSENSESEPDPRFLILALTNTCNLGCAYCYRGDALADDTMPPEMIEQSIALAEQSGHPFHVQLSGGEPTMMPHLIEHAAQTLRKRGCRASLAVQTNGTLIDRPLARMFKQYDIQVGVSLDGGVALQERLRGRAADTLKGMKMLEAEDIPFRVTTVVSHENADHLAELVVLLSTFANAGGIGLDLLTLKGRVAASDRIRPAEPSQLKNGLNRMMKMLTVVNRRRFRPLRLREAELLKRFEQTPRAAHFCYAARGQSLAVAPDGALYPCGQVMGDADCDLGTLDAPDVSRLKILSRYRLPETDCADCPLNTCCPGECPSRLKYNGPETGRLACVMYRTLYDNHPDI